MFAIASAVQRQSVYLLYCNNLYPWYYMPSTVHKLLIHGAEVIQTAALPIGQLSEEAQENRNKDYKTFRLHHARKISRLTTNEDVFHRILESSDPYISHLRPEMKKKHIQVSAEALKFLKVLENITQKKN
ncbi:uncharacterized protein LOC143187644 [Calliopsis andreniformis]|uniref:uncharacterized protein LOC143187644 n=1 Tax=Calliopsis andreniformis TaxID=337506 RepID=UPI003FCD30E2